MTMFVGDLPNPSVYPNDRGDNEKIVICFSHLRWDFVYQRPQHLISRAAKEYQVYFFEEPVFETAGRLPRLELRRKSDRLTVAVPVLGEGAGEAGIASAQKRLLDELLLAHPGAGKLFWYYTPMALDFSGHVEPDLCVYDCMDQLAAFQGAPTRLSSLEQDLFTRCDLVFTGGRSLYAAKRDKHPSVHCFPSSIDREHFAKARDAAGPDPLDQRALRRPRIGFFGVVDERMDLALVKDIAERRPEWEFVILGPVAKIDPASLPRRDNLHWLGQKSYADLPAYLAHWDAGIMPFALNESTRFISPTKTPEFLAAGVPVLSTPIADVVSPYDDIGLVEIANGGDQAVDRLDLLLRRDRHGWLARVDRYLSGLSWDATWAEMKGLLAEAEEQARSPASSASSGPASRACRRGRAHV